MFFFPIPCLLFSKINKQINKPKPNNSYLAPKQTGICYNTLNSRNEVHNKKLTPLLCNSIEDLSLNNDMYVLIGTFLMFLESQPTHLCDEKLRCFVRLLS